LFKRRFVVRERKNLVPTKTGIQLIHTIENELLKSAELTGMWEKKLRQIEKGEYDPKLFLDEMKEMVSQLVNEVKRENKKAIAIEQEEQPTKKEKEKLKEEKPAKPRKTAQKKEPAKIEEPATMSCPKCKKGTLLKGRTAWGCSEYKNGCTFKVMFEQYGITLTDKQIFALIEKGKTPKIKGLVIDGQPTDSSLTFDSAFNLIPEIQKEKNDSPDEDQRLF
ncbi:MAG TPA: DNA topoisomerase, partial [Prolixibacteraceae bacterium]|nr:DNA topoisomerase [Prolixibacteraceae bacterium]